MLTRTCTAPNPVLRVVTFAEHKWIILAERRRKCVMPGLGPAVAMRLLGAGFPGLAGAGAASGGERCRYEGLMDLQR
jgi:hypothetical protein